MAYFSDGMPRPDPNRDDEGFWRGCAEQRLQFQTCADCGTCRHPPIAVCAQCRSVRVTWTPTTGRAQIYTYTVIHHAAHPAVAARLPYVTAVVSFDDIPAVRLLTNITHCDPADVRIGMAVELRWDDIGDGLFLPRFRPPTGVSA